MLPPGAHCRLVRRLVWKEGVPGAPSARKLYIDVRHRPFPALPVAAAFMVPSSARPKATTADLILAREGVLGMALAVASQGYHSSPAELGLLRYATTPSDWQMVEPLGGGLDRRRAPAEGRRGFRGTPENCKTKICLRCAGSCALVP